MKRFVSILLVLLLVLGGVFAATPPQVTNAAFLMGAGSYTVDTNIDINVFFDQPVILSGNVSVGLNSGGTANYLTGVGSNALTLRYLVQAGENSANLDFNSDFNLLVANTLKDVGDTLDANTELGPFSLSGSGIIIDTNSPIIIDVDTNTPDGNYNAGDSIDLNVIFSENVYLVGGNPVLTVNTGENATYIEGTGTPYLIFRYTIGSDKFAADLNYPTVDVLNPAGGITDLAGNDANT